MNFISVKTYDEMSCRAADLIAGLIRLKPACVLGLATGSSPIGTYDTLVKYHEAGTLDFSSVTSVNLDEYVGLDGTNEQSYRYFMDKHLFSRVNIDPAKTFVPDGCTKDPAASGRAYDEMIRKLGGIDLQLLGIGPDGHIGFNEPAPCFIAPTHEVVLDESTIEANARFFADRNEVPRKAITMGMMSIMQAKKILLIAAGEMKKAVVKKAFEGDVDPMLPASILQLHPDVTVIVAD